MKYLATLALITLLAGGTTGCTTLADAGSSFGGLGIISNETSTFDGATVIEVSPNFLYNPESTWGVPIQMGARWTSNAKDYIGLILEYPSSSNSSNAYTRFDRIEVMIDGTNTELNVTGSTQLSNSGYNSVSKRIYTDSRATVAVRYDFFLSMLNAENCRLRIHTSDGYSDAIFSIDRIPGGSKSARMSLREFLAEVETTKSAPIDKATTE